MAITGGWFTEIYSKRMFKEKQIDIDFVQDNHSMFAQNGTLRGLHFQTNPKSQTKLIICTKGKILDVAVDLRRVSSTYKKWISVELTEETKIDASSKRICPRVFNITDNVEVQCKVDEYYAPECDRSIRFDNPEFGVVWGIENPILSEKDLSAPLIKESDVDLA